jgi:para-aminobenzoate synthetase component 1
MSRPIVAEIGWPTSIADLMRAVAALDYPIFFDSARVDPALGRYSFLTACPFEIIRSRRGSVEVVDSLGHETRKIAADPFAVLADRLRRYTIGTMDELPPFQGGAAGLFSYDLCHHLERLPRPPYDEFEVPELVVGLYDWVIALDYAQRQAWVISTGLPHSGSDRERHAHDQLENVVRFLKQPAIRDHQSEFSRHLRGGSSANECGFAADCGETELAPQWRVASMHPGLTSNFSHAGYLQAVRRAIDSIYAGDVYQVNVAQRLLAPLVDSPIDLYLRLRERNPAPFAAYFDVGDVAIASASPERFLRVQNGEVETRPIKGTRPRWPVPEADMFSAGELRESDKDRAENVMIVDLLRNDLGRVCEYGSVRVTEPLRLETYEFVHHLVSEVRGRLRPDSGPIDLLRAAFPGGSVTGAPKIRAMEIIAELEPTARGPYCGSLGYIGFNGTMDTSILIRTFTCGRGWVQFPVGGGIVAQSSPEREYEETLHKAEGMIRALQ